MKARVARREGHEFRLLTVGLSDGHLCLSLLECARQGLCTASAVSLGGKGRSLVTLNNALHHISFGLPVRDVRNAALGEPSSPRAAMGVGEALSGNPAP